MKEEVLKIFVEEFGLPKETTEKFLDSLGDISNMDQLRKASEKLLLETILENSQNKEGPAKAL